MAGGWHSVQLAIMENCDQPNNNWIFNCVEYCFAFEFIFIASLTFKSLAVTLRTSGFEFEKFYVVLQLHLCAMCESHNKQPLLPYTALTDRFCIIEVESVYCAEGTES